MFSIGLGRDPVLLSFLLRTAQEMGGRAGSFANHRGGYTRMGPRTPPAASCTGGATLWRSLTSWHAGAPSLNVIIQIIMQQEATRVAAASSLHDRPL
jgi:hypothetical protein